MVRVGSVAIHVGGIAAPAAVSDGNAFERDLWGVFGDPVCNVWDVLSCVAFAGQVQVVGGKRRELCVKRHESVRVGFSLRRVVPRARRLDLAVGGASGESDRVV